MTGVDGSATDGGRRSPPWWAVAILVATAVAAAAGWYLDRAADHPALAEEPRSYIVFLTPAAVADAVPATVVAVTSPRDLLLDIGPAITHSGQPPAVQPSHAQAPPIGLTSVRLRWVGLPPLGCHAAEAKRLAADIVKPGSAVMVRAVDVTAAETLADVLRPNGANVAAELVAAGAAPMLVGPDGSVLGDVFTASRVAQGNHLGIWAPCATPK